MRLRPTPMILAGGGAPVFNISPAVNGKVRWDLDVDGPLDLLTPGSYAITPLSGFEAWGEFIGGGGGSLNPGGFFGGAGMLARGLIRFRAGVTYTLFVASGGGVSGPSSTPGQPGGGGATNPTATGRTLGGGYSGLRKSNGAPVIIAAGGGGGGWSPRGGAGGYPNGQDSEGPYQGYQPGRGGTQTAGGAGFNPGAAYQGGAAVQDYAGAGGGGYFGGGSGQGPTSGGTGGGGGSGFYDPAEVSGFAYENGDRQVPGGFGDLAHVLFVGSGAGHKASGGGLGRNGRASLWSAKTPPTPAARVRWAQASFNGTSSYSFTLPGAPTMQAGDLILVLGFGQLSAGMTCRRTAPSQGALFPLEFVDADPDLAVLQKVAEAADLGATLTISAAAINCAFQVVVIRGVSAVVNRSQLLAPAGATPYALPGTPKAATCRGLMALAASRDSGPPTPSAGSPFEPLQPIPAAYNEYGQYWYAGSYFCGPSRYPNGQAVAFETSAAAKSFTLWEMIA